MAFSSILLASTLLSTVICGSEGLPKVETQGDAVPLVQRAVGTAARTRTCYNGTEFIVTFKDGAQEKEVIGIMNERLGGSPNNLCRSLRHSDTTDGQLNAITVCIPPEHDVEAHIQVLSAMEGVKAVEENVPVNLIDHEAVASPLWGAPWHLDRIDQPYLPLDGNYAPGATGRGVVAFITDTGCAYTYEEFGNRVTAGFSALYGQSATQDRENHGTHTCGILGSRTYGVAKDVTIVPIKVFSDLGGGASGADIVEGINWAIAQKRGFATTAVLSMSLGMPGPFYAGDQALLLAVQSGLVPIVAAGNDGRDACGTWPASSNYVLTVGSTEPTDYRSSFSNYGSCVDIYAPGSNVLSTLPGGRSGYMSGTSMACPVVSGIASLYLERHPYATFQQVKDAIIRNAVGRRDRAPAYRMLLVQAKETTPWSLLEQTASGEVARRVDVESSYPMIAKLAAAIASVFITATVIATVIIRKARKDFISEKCELEHSSCLRC